MKPDVACALRVVVCWILAGFLAVVNGVGWWALRHDKKAARSRAHRSSSRRRVSERWLHGLGFFGGFPAMMLAMGRYRHKTRKLAFQVPFFVVALVSSLLWAGWLSVLGCLGGVL